MGKGKIKPESFSKALKRSFKVRNVTKMEVDKALSYQDKIQKEMAKK